MIIIMSEVFVRMCFFLDFVLIKDFKAFQTFTNLLQANKFNLFLKHLFQIQVVTRKQE